MNFEHVIIIRFSTIFKERNEFNNTENLFKEENLDTRFDLFEKFCLWTIVNQSLISYKVIIIYDKDLPEKYYNKLYELTKDYDFIILHKWIIQHFLHENFWLEPYIDKSKEYLITSRFDDDDILNLKNNERLIEYINKRGTKRFDNSIISFSKGKFIFYENDTLSISKCNYDTPGLWLSYVSKIDYRYNIFSMNHCSLKNIKIHRLYFDYNFGILNHHYGNDKRIIRFKKAYKNIIEKTTLDEIYKLFSS